jgi:hypothetical protein
MSRCYNCRGESNGELLCPECEVGVMNRTIRLKFPGVSGVTDGPGSCNGELIFDRPNPPKDIALTLKRMEADGKLRDPDAMVDAKTKLDEAKSKPFVKVDYGKEGHPLDH